MAKTVRCPQCGRLISASAAQCRYCGISIDGTASAVSTNTAKSSPVDSPTSDSAVTPDIKAGVAASTEKLTDLVGKLSSKVKEKGQQLQESAQKAATKVSTPPKGKAQIETDNTGTASDNAQPTEQVPPTPAQTEPTVTTPPPTSYDYCYQQPAAEPQKPKSKTGLIVTIIILAAIVLIGGGVAAYFLLGNNSGPEAVVAADTVKTDTAEAIPAEEAEADPVNHYNFDTILSGVPVVINLDIDPDGNVTGKYAYKSTLKKYGDKPASWFTLKGQNLGGSIELEASHPDYGVFEYWSVNISGKPEMPVLKGEVHNNNTYEVFYVGSPKKAEKYYDPTMGGDPPFEDEEVYTGDFEYTGY